MKSFVILIAVIFVFPVFSGCKRETSLEHTPKTRITETKKIETKLEAKVQEAPDVKEEIYVYEPKGRRDPFVPLVEITRKKVAKGKGISGTLEGYDIVDFKLIAVVEKEGQQYYALLLTPDNKSYTVREGTVLGLNKGKVKKITSNEVVIREYIKDYKGELKPRQIVLELRKREVEE